MGNEVSQNNDESPQMFWKPLKVCAMFAFTRIWAARDALAWPYSEQAFYHLAKRGGGKAAVRAVQTAIGTATVVFRSDVKGGTGVVQWDNPSVVPKNQQVINDL